MPVWIRSRHGVSIRLRDGMGHGAPVRVVGKLPVLFVAIDRARVEADPEIEIVAAPTAQVAPVRPPDRPAQSEPAPMPTRRRRGRR